MTETNNFTKLQGLHTRIKANYHTLRSVLDDDTHDMKWGYLYHISESITEDLAVGLKLTTEGVNND